MNIQSSARNLFSHITGMELCRCQSRWLSGSIVKVHGYTSSADQIILLFNVDINDNFTKISPLKGSLSDFIDPNLPDEAKVEILLRYA